MKRVPDVCAERGLSRKLTEIREIQEWRASCSPGSDSGKIQGGTRAFKCYKESPNHVVPLLDGVRIRQPAVLLVRSGIPTCFRKETQLVCG